ncbi:MAG: acetyl-CoA carboxylase carboxyltransferase subunit alpha [Planctomycetota bacterium]
MAKKKQAPQPGPSSLGFERPIEDVQHRLEELEELAQKTTHDLSEELDFYRDRLARLTREIYSDLSAWQRVQVARHPNRPLTSDYIESLCDDWVELHGDGSFGDDPAIVTGLATIRGRQVMLVGHRKGKDTKQRLACNFGSAHPEGYRKALRKMQLAERMGLPIVCLVNTPGAYPGVGAEERGQARAIAENIYHMFSLKVPVLVVVIGEGGSGGALGLGIGDRVGMLENAWYSVISPEGCASILWRSAEGKERAAEALKLTAPSLLKLGIVDEVVPEPLGAAHHHREQSMAQVADTLLRWLDELEGLSVEELLERRHRKFRRIAMAEEALEAAALQEAPPSPEGESETETVRERTDEASSS